MDCSAHKETPVQLVPGVVLVLAYPGGHGEHVYESTSGVHVVNGSHGFRVAQKSITNMIQERMNVGADRVL